MAGSSQSSPGNRDQIALTRRFQCVARLAERQWGVVADWQLTQCAVSKSAIARWVAAGRLHRIYPRVYAVGHTALCMEGQLLAAILYAGPGAALSHGSAAYWWGLLPYLPDAIDVTSPPPTQITQRGPRPPDPTPRADEARGPAGDAGGEDPPRLRIDRAYGAGEESSRRGRLPPPRGPRRDRGSHGHRQTWERQAQASPLPSPPRICPHPQ